jgi:hypothetical protein
MDNNGLFYGLTRVTPRTLTLNAFGIGTDADAKPKH